MRIFVKVKPGAKETRVEAKDTTHFNVAVVEPAQDGKANRAIVKALAQHLDIAPSRITIITGVTVRQKLVEIT